MGYLGNIPADKLARPTIERELVARAFHDAEFLQQFVSNPRERLEQELEVTLPADVEVELHQETTTTIHIILPAASAHQAARQDARLQTLWGSRTAGAATAALSELPEEEWTRMRLERSLIQHVAADAEFHDRLVNSPAGTLTEFLGVEIPAHYNIEVHEESEHRLHLVLPNNPNVPLEVRNTIADEKLKAVVYSCVDMCLTAAATACGTCTLVTYCTD